MEIAKYIWVALALPMGWLFLLIASAKKEQAASRNTLWERLREVEATLRSIELQVNSIEQKYITDVKVREIIKDEFKPIRDEYTETKVMLKQLSVSLVTLEKEIIKMIAKNSE